MQIKLPVKMTILHIREIEILFRLIKSPLRPSVAWHVCYHMCMCAIRKEKVQTQTRSFSNSVRDFDNLIIACLLKAVSLFQVCVQWYHPLYILSGLSI